MNIAIVGTDDINIQCACAIIDTFISDAKEEMIQKADIKYFVALWQETEELVYFDIDGIPMCSVSAAIEAYRNGLIEWFVIPQGIYMYLVPILLLEGIRVDSIYCVSELQISGRRDNPQKEECLLRPFTQTGFLHPKTDLERDKTVRQIGKRYHTCRVCGENGEFNSYLAREMMQDKRDEFEYFVCPNCLCLQIGEVPDNLGDYYGEGYYSFAFCENPNRKFDKPISKMEKILDVGCGSGEWLVKMAELGYGNLYGVDPFLPHDIRHGDRVYIRNCSIHDLEDDGTYDFIRFSDSFEHVTDPIEVLDSASRLLGEDGVIELKIPTYPNIAFDIFGPHWYQLDAPRHIFLFSLISINNMAQKIGLRILDYKYDSNFGQFDRSLMYLLGVPFYKTDEVAYKYISAKEQYEMEFVSEYANKKNYGDHMMVRLVKE